MKELCELLVELLYLNGGTVVGKTRLQKMVFLLDECGLNTGCQYDYHYYGPYSAQIAEATEDARELHLLEYHERPGYHAVPYGVYSVAGDVTVPNRLGDLSRSVVEEKLQIMGRYSAVELELAATILYLRDQGAQNPIEEVKLLKTAKATSQHLNRAQQLLHGLELWQSA